MSQTHKASHPHATEVFTSDLAELKQGFENLRSDVNDLVKSVADSGHSGAKAARQIAAGAVHGVQHKIHDIAEAGSDSLESLADRIAERPFTSAVVAVAAGYILFKWMSRH